MWMFRRKASIDATRVKFKGGMKDSLSSYNGEIKKIPKHILKKNAKFIAHTIMVYVMISVVNVMSVYI